MLSRYLISWCRELLLPERARILAADVTRIDIDDKMQTALKQGTSTSTGQDGLSALNEYRGAFTRLRDLIWLRYAAKQASRELDNLIDNKTANPLAGLMTSRFRGRGIDFAEVRVYQPGDDIRTIDWRVTARTGVAHTKLFQEERERPVLLLVDQSSSMYFGSRVMFKSVLAARTAALLAWAVLERGDRIGGIVFSEHGHREIRPRRNKHAVLRLLNELHGFNQALGKEPSAARYKEPSAARYEEPSAVRNKEPSAVRNKEPSAVRNKEPSAGKTPTTEPANPTENYFTQALANVRRVSRPGSVIFIISDFASYTDASRIHLQPLARHNEVIGIHISDALEQTLPSPDLYSITDGNQRTRINTLSRKHREAYEARFRHGYQFIQDEFQRLRSPLIPLQTGLPMMEGLALKAVRAGMTRSRDL